MALAMPCPCCVPPSNVRRTMRSRVPCRRATRSLPRSGFRRVILPERTAAQVECQQESTKATRVRLAEDERHFAKVQHELRIGAQQVTADVAVEVVVLDVRDERLKHDIELLRDDDRIAQHKPHVGEHSHGSLLDAASPTLLSHQTHRTRVDLLPESTIKRLVELCLAGARIEPAEQRLAFPAHWREQREPVEREIRLRALRLADGNPKLGD